MNPIYVTQSFLPPLEEYVEHLKKIWETHQLTTNGPLHNELEQALCARLGWKNASLFANGHLALEIALKSLNTNSGYEIITTPYTYVSTLSAIVNQGFIPVFCDINDRFTIDIEQIETLITEKTVAILPVHVYGFPCDVEAITKIAKKHGLKVIYDAAHAFGVKVDGKDIASFGDISMFSFQATKLFHTVEGGALVYYNDLLRKNFELYKNFGISGPDTIELVGLNAKMNEFEAAMGLAVLPYLDEIIKRRKKIYEHYMEILNDVSNIVTFSTGINEGFNYAYVPILIENGRDRVYNYLAEHNIYARKYFYPCLSKVECYRKYLRNNSLEKAENTSDKVLTLPISHTIMLEHVEYICSLIKQATQLTV